MVQKLAGLIRTHSADTVYNKGMDILRRVAVEQDVEIGEYAKMRSEFHNLMLRSVTHCGEQVSALLAILLECEPKEIERVREHFL